MRSAPRLVIIALLGLFLALPVVTALSASAEPAGNVPAEDLVVQTTTAPPSSGATAPSGPKLEPDTEADEAETQRKLIMGATSVVLLGIVIWGRSIRRKKKKAAEGG